MYLSDPAEAAQAAEERTATPTGVRSGRVTKLTTSLGADGSLVTIPAVAMCECPLVVCPAAADTRPRAAEPTPIPTPTLTVRARNSRRPSTPGECPGSVMPQTRFEKDGRGHLLAEPSCTNSQEHGCVPVLVWHYGLARRVCCSGTG